MTSPNKPCSSPGRPATSEAHEKDVGANKPSLPKPEPDHQIPLQGLSSIVVRLARLPWDITTGVIHHNLASLYNLNVTKIEILEDNNGRRSGLAFVTVEPPPDKWPPWNNHAGVWFTRQAKPQIRVQVDIYRSNPAGAILQTPTNQEAPRQLSLNSLQLLFGLPAGEESMYELEQYDYQGVRLAIQYWRRFIEITFQVQLDQKGIVQYKIPIKFSHIKKILRVKQENGRAGMVIHLPSAPEIYSKVNSEASYDDDLTFWQERDLWVRQTEITRHVVSPKHACAKLQKDYDTVDFGRWNTYYIEIAQEDVHLLDHYIPRLMDWNIKLGSTDNFRLVKPNPVTAWTLLDANTANQGQLSSLELLSAAHNVHLPFEVHYQLEACISQGLLNEYSIDTAFLEKLNTYESDRSRMMLEGVADRNLAFYNPVDLFENHKITTYWPTARITPQAAVVRKAIITPTGIIFKTPTVELTNRILRHYSDLSDRFLRVQFTDEISVGKIWSDQGSVKSDELYLRVLRTLLNGIVVANRHYKILAWSNSQFREHGAFFFCETDHVTCDDIREWMGDLKHIRSVGKYAARMGQCFTTTRQVSGISVPKITPITDIERRVDGRLWNFTDGVGKISPFIARMIAHEQNMADVPSCFQVRMGGCKGVLVVWPDVPPNEVHIRPSQQKFTAPYNGLETIKVSGFSQATLNRQVIPILSCLGVGDKVFLDLLEEELKEYDEAIADPYKASELLRRRVDENQTSLAIAEMIDTFMEGEEPFVWTLLRLWKCWSLTRLKQKAAISVKKSAFLYGCVDELGILRGHSKETEGKGIKDEKTLPQIFLQIPMEGYDPSNTECYRVITGLCVVGRNPSLHPGDIRVVQAVDVPGLRHLKNVVVFPQDGDRDIPSMCSGGDLDGDDFFVIWDERLLPKEWDFPPMDHDADAGSLEANGAEITIGNMCSFFAQYMKNDSLGLIATAHVAWADKVGPKHPKCIELSKLHSKAVDYVKSGNPATMHKSLNPKNFPHFMERDKKTYQSTKPLGRVYDRVRGENLLFHPAYEKPFDRRILKRFQLTPNETSNAVDIKAKYDVALRRLMGQHERPISEFEIWSTYILTKPRVGNDYKLQETVGREIASLKERFRCLVGETLTGNVRDDDGDEEKRPLQVFSYAGIEREKLERFVAAMYTVTYDEVQAAIELRNTPLLDSEGVVITESQPEYPMPLISFPWLFHKELARVAAGARNTESNTDDVSGPVWPIPNATAGCEVESDDEEEGTGKATNQYVKGKEEAEAQILETGDEEDYVHTASGEIVHRGEMLNLFNEDDTACAENVPPSPPPSTGEAISAVTAESAPELHTHSDENEDGDFEEVELNLSDYEDPLEILAQMVAGKT